MGGSGGNRRPLIGITVEKDGEYLKVRHEYASAVVGGGGIALLIPCHNDPSVIAETIDGLLIPGGGDIDPSYYSERLRGIRGEFHFHQIKPYDAVSPIPLNPSPKCKGEGGDEMPPQYPVVSKERTDFEIALIRSIMKHEKPLFGICCGMQIINVALGGSLYRDIGEELVTAIDHRVSTHRIAGDGAVIKGEHTVNSSHHQAVKDLGKGLRPAAFSDDLIVEAFKLDGYPFLVGVQWHPERSDDELSRNLFRSFISSANAGR
jgi:putative glutamine amidotransferase